LEEKNKMNKLTSVLFASTVVFLAGCDRAPANVKTLQTTDCGVHWNVIAAGQRIPTTVGSPCSYNTVLPDYPMQGDLEFKAQFEGNVLVTAKISYDYEIVDPIKFLGEAKFLGKHSGTAEDAAKGSNMGGIEAAENQVIDKRIREAATSRTVKLNIVDFNPAKFEDELLNGSNNDLAARGVRLNSMTLVIIPEDQTRQAIDAATAMNVYASKGLTTLGEKLAIARAGASKIVVESK
jgi:hypothetical protein